MARPCRYLLCVKNRGYPTALEVRKVYQELPDSDAEERGLVRVIDESGADYLYPSTFFVVIAVPRRAVKVFARKSA